MNKNFIILIIVIVILGAVVGYLAFNFVSRPALNANAPISANLNKISANINQPAASLGNPDLYMAAAKKEKLSYWTYYSLLQFASFCEAKAGYKSLVNTCDELNNKYLYLQDQSYCKSKTSYLAMLYLVKAQNKEKFIQICEDYKKTRPQIDCNQAWQNILVTDFCDDAGKGCPALVTDSAKSSCKNPVNINTVDVAKLQDSNCQKFIPLIKAKQSSDCQSIKDDLTRLMCLDLYDSKVCPEASDLLDKGDLAGLIKKYPLQNCCFYLDPNDPDESINPAY